jgi:hypothetical protein
MFQLRADRIVKRLAILGQLHRLMLAGEQALAHEIFQRAHTARQSGRGKPQFIGRRLGRTKADDTHKRLKGAQGREAA